MSKVSTEIMAISNDLDRAINLADSQERMQAAVALAARIDKVKQKVRNGFDEELLTNMSNSLLREFFRPKDYPRRVECMYAGNDNGERLGVDEVPIYAVVKDPEDPDLREVRYVSLDERRAQEWREPFSTRFGRQVEDLFSFPDETQVVLLSSDGYNAIYIDGKIKDQGKPEYVNVETAYRVYDGMPNTDVKMYTVPEDLREANLDGEPYPDNLSDWPLVLCTQVIS